MVNFKNKTYLSVGVLGKNLKLDIKYVNIDCIELNQKTNQIEILLPKSYKGKKDIDVINLAIKKMYDILAETEIEYSMEIARHILGFAPSDYRIERINGFISCTRNKITINPDIMQFNRDIINTNIIEAFCKTKYKVSSKQYKETLQYALHEYNKSKNSNYRPNLWVLSA